MTPLLAQRLRTDRSFERMYRRHAADVYHYALAICRNETDAEDVTQTTFMNAYRAVQSGEHPRTPKNWLIAIAHNVCRQRFRQAARRPAEVELDDGVAAFVPDDQGPSAEDIRRALSELAFNQRAALVMRELEGRSYAEIADILGISTSAVETLIFRARRALREQLEGSLTCGEAELALSKQLDGRLSRAEKGALRAHLRSCKECATFARSQRAQRSALQGLAALPLPSSLASLFGGGAGVGSALATKAAAVTALGLLAAGASVETAQHHPWRSHHARAAVAAPADVQGATPQAVVRPAQFRPTTSAHKAPARLAPTTQAKHGLQPKDATPTAKGQLKPEQPQRPEQALKSAKPHGQQAKSHKQKAHAHERGSPAAGHGKPVAPPDDGSAAPKGKEPRAGGAQPSGSQDQPAPAQPGDAVTVPLAPVPLPEPHLPNKP